MPRTVWSVVIRYPTEGKIGSSAVTSVRIDTTIARRGSGEAATPRLSAFCRKTMTFFPILSGWGLSRFRRRSLCRWGIMPGSSRPVGGRGGESCVDASTSFSSTWKRGSRGLRWRVCRGSRGRGGGLLLNVRRRGRRVVFEGRPVGDMHGWCPYRSIFGTHASKNTVFLPVWVHRMDRCKQEEGRLGRDGAQPCFCPADLLSLFR